jgi:hypothetical protein
MSIGQVGSFAVFDVYFYNFMSGIVRICPVLVTLYSTVVGNNTACKNSLVAPNFGPSPFGWY